jgi:divalent metal cation (Fe/Co/Zn/Cd) transporter
MGIGVGILLVVVGLVLLLQVFPDIPNVDDVTLGWILLAVGLLGLALALVMNAQRSRTTHVEERRYDDGGRRY